MGIKTLPVADLQPGMTLAQSIQDNKGRTIVPEGTRLTPMAINHLTKWSVQEVKVKSDEETTVHKPSASGRSIVESANEEDREFMRHVAEQVASRFRNAANIEINSEMRRLAIKYLVLKGKGAIPGL